MARRPWTEEEKRQISERMKKAHAEGRARSPMLDEATRKKVSESLKGKGHPQTEESRQKIREAQTKAYAEGKRPRVQPHMIEQWDNSRGKPTSDEHKRKTSEGNHRSWAEGRRNRKRSPEYRRKISEGMKRAYEEGRVIAPLTNPETAAKVSASKLGTSLSKTHKRQISKTLKKGYADGVYPSPKRADEHYEKLADMKRGKPIPKERAQKIRETVKQHWDEGTYEVRNYTATVRYPGYPTPHEEMIAPQLLELGFIQQLALTTGARRPSGHLETYYYDFAHEEAKLIIEIDGGSHTGFAALARDKMKELLAKNHGFRLVRFTNEQVEADPSSILSQVQQTL